MSQLKYKNRRLTGFSSESDKVEKYLLVDTLRRVSWSEKWHLAWGSQTSPLKKKSDLSNWYRHEPVEIWGFSRWPFDGSAFHRVTYTIKSNQQLLANLSYNIKFRWNGCWYKTAIGKQISRSEFESAILLRFKYKIKPNEINCRWNGKWMPICRYESGKVQNPVLFDISLTSLPRFG